MLHICVCVCVFCIKGAEKSADLKIRKSSPLSLNHHNFSNIELICTKESFMESLLSYLASGS